MSFFSAMNRKEKRKFNKLSPEEQAKFIEVEIMQKVSPVMSKEITRAMMQGMNIVWEKLFDEYVNALDDCENEAEWTAQIDRLSSEIRKNHLRIEASKMKEEQSEVATNEV